jgi:hypothetical protein
MMLKPRKQGRQSPRIARIVVVPAVIDDDNNI